MANCGRQVSRVYPARRDAHDRTHRARGRSDPIHGARRGPRGSHRHVIPGAGGRHVKTQQAEWLATPERGSTRLLRSMVFVSLRVGRTLSRGVLYGIAVYFFLFAPGARRHSRRYLRLALGRSPRAKDRFRHILYFATCIHDRVFLLNEQYGRFHITIEGESLVRAQLDAGRGAFLLGAHLGSFELMRSIGLRQRGLHVSMAMYQRNAQKMHAVSAAINPAASPDIIALGEIDAMLQVAERLDRGAFVGVLGDRTLGDEAVQA